MGLYEEIKLEIDCRISNINNLKTSGIFIESTIEEIMLNDVDWIIRRTKQIGLERALCITKPSVFNSHLKVWVCQTKSIFYSILIL